MRTSELIHCQYWRFGIAKILACVQTILCCDPEGRERMRPVLDNLPNVNSRAQLHASGARGLRCGPGPRRSRYARPTSTLPQPTTAGGGGAPDRAAHATPAPPLPQPTTAGGGGAPDRAAHAAPAPPRVCSSRRRLAPAGPRTAPLTLRPPRLCPRRRRLAAVGWQESLFF